MTVGAAQDAVDAGVELVRIHSNAVPRCILEGFVRVAGEAVCLSAQDNRKGAQQQNGKCRCQSSGAQSNSGWLSLPQIRFHNATLPRERKERPGPATTSSTKILLQTFRGAGEGPCTSPGEP